MDLLAPPLAKPCSFRHGVHPQENKQFTNREPLERMPFVDTYFLPLSQHIGAPARALVGPGDRVVRGQKIAEPGSYVSTAHHAPVTGTVESIELRPHPNGKLMESIVIRSDPFSDQRLPEKAPLVLGDKDALIKQVQQAGIVGLGGAAFPSHVKLSVPEGKRAEFLIINGCECEPYLTCDHRLMLEQPAGVIRGLQIIMEQLDVGRGYVGVEMNKADAIYKLEALAKPHENIVIVPLAVKYPQGAEKMLIEAVLKREVPEGKLPIDIEVVSYNVGSAVAIAQLVDHGTPLIERIVTVTGPAVSKPRNLLVPIGTPVLSVLEHCGLQVSRLRQLIMGGPMMGMAQKDLDAPILKGTSGLLALDSLQVAEREEMPCIRCGRCLDACPMFLNPSRLAMMARAEWAEELEAHHLMNCFECGACSFVCPSFIPLAQLMRLGKTVVRQHKQKEASA